MVSRRNKEFLLLNKKEHPIKMAILNLGNSRESKHELPLVMWIDSQLK